MKQKLTSRDFEAAKVLVYHFYLAWKLNELKTLLYVHEMPCKQCGCLRLHQIREVSEDSVILQCRMGHMNHWSVTFPKEIQGHYAKGIFDGSAERHLNHWRKNAMIHPAIKRLAKYRYEKIPTGYEDPRHSFYPSWYLMSMFGQSTHDRHRVNHIVKDLCTTPIFKWVHHSLVDAVRESSPPPYEMSLFSWPFGVFFLPQNALVTPNGGSCPWLAFTHIEPGFHSLPGGCRYYHASYLIVWTFSPNSSESYTAEVPTNIDFATAMMSPIYAPANPEHCEFIRKMIRMVMLLNTTAHLNKSLFAEKQKTRKSKKKKRQHDHALVFKTASVLGSSASPTKKEALHSNGRTRDPYWVRGYEQRYRVGPRNDWKYIVHWRPPQLIGEEVVFEA